MPDILKRLAGPVYAAASATTVYTTPAATTTTVRALRVCNETATAASFTLSIGTDGAGKRLWHQYYVQPGDPYDWTGFIVLGTTEVIQVLASTASALTVTISGVEST